MATPILRPDQKTFVQGIYDALKSHRAVLGVFSTGGGKTFCFSSIISAHTGGSLTTVHRKRIIIQISKSFALFGVRHRVIAPEHVIKEARRQHMKKFGQSYIDRASRVGIASVQTITSKASAKNRKLKLWLSGVSLAVFDEGHHYVKTGQWAKSVELIPDTAKMIFVTATPERCDGKGLGAHADGFIEAMVEGPPLRWLIDNGRLSRYKYYCPKTDFSVDDIPLTSSGDFNRNLFRSRVVKSGLVGDVVQHYITYAKGLKTIVFATDVKTAEEMAALFTKTGYPAVSLSYKTPLKVIEKNLEKYESGEIKVLINVDLFDEGFDVPDTEADILARPTESLCKYLQEIGRVLRVAEGKEHAIIIDCVRNWERHGHFTWPRVWSLDSREKRTGKPNDGRPKLKICVNCTQPYEAFLRKCPYCGHVDKPIGRRKLEQVDGDLFELDADALAAVFDKVKRANMSGDEYKAELRRKGCPVIGIPRNVKMHNEVLHKRKVLYHLMSWWIGSQNGRDLSEIYRRFFHRFGIDAATAFTLNRSETEELISRIAERYQEDL